ncbi:YvcK family protein [Proteiniclasticum sp.]|uniref:gluconeogenesis factor YvcK family protein n=1 Tax=Proteiniclasticum sp. TaxID=2053595 RepID=UPI0028A2DBBA|nr:YvcK family protein [Proteiniclasticum sp.]
MKIKDWMNMGYGIKRWFGLGIVGLSVIIFALIELIFQRYGKSAYNFYYIYLLILGVSVLYVSIAELIKSFMTLAKDGLIDFNMDSREIGSLIHEKKLLVQGPKVVIIGGGTGLSTILKGLKNYTNNITAVVTVADDGGGSGILREDLGILPPGDIRNCLVALANTEPLMEELMQYRFKDGSLKGQSFGNLFLAAMNGVSDNFEDAVQNMANVLAITGKVLPVTLDNVKINAILDNGQLVVGESHIPEVSISEGAKIRKLYVTPENAQCLPDVREEILNADAIILGPGSLYTSVIPNLIIKGVPEAIKESRASKIYICNVMTQPGETDEFKVSDHIRAIYEHGDIGKLDYVFANTMCIRNEHLRKKYHDMKQYEVIVDEEKLRYEDFELILGDFIKPRETSVRHDADKLSKRLMEIILKETLVNDKRRILEYVVLSGKLKNKKN